MHSTDRHSRQIVLKGLYDRLRQIQEDVDAFLRQYHDLEQIVQSLADSLVECERKCDDKG